MECYYLSAQVVCRTYIQDEAVVLDISMAPKIWHICSYYDLIIFLLLVVYNVHKTIFNNKIATTTEQFTINTLSCCKQMANFLLKLILNASHHVIQLLQFIKRKY